MGRIGIINDNDNETVSIHCLEGACRLQLDEEEPVTISTGAFTAVSQTGEIVAQGAANYSIFSNIISSVLGALPTETPTPTHTATPLPTATATLEPSAVETTIIEIGRSVEGISIEAFQFGDGANSVIFIGGMHATYAPNTVQVAEEAITYFNAHPEEVPNDVTLYIIPNLNPDSDGDVGRTSGRLNAQGVDLNRNWDCRWQEDTTVLGIDIPGSGGTAVHSEPETKALLSFMEDVNPQAVIVWGAGQREIGAVAPGSCLTQTINSIPLSIYYGIAAQYDYPESQEVKANQSLTGDLTNYLDQIGIPAAFIIMPSFTEYDFERELAGVNSVLQAMDGNNLLKVTPTPENCEEYDLDNWGEQVDFIIIRPIGCSISTIFSPQGAFQRFQAGWMLWRHDEEIVYVLYDDGNIVETYSVNSSNNQSFEGPPLLKGAFGFVHTTNSHVASNLGAPFEAEQSTNDFRVQDFDNGMIFRFSNDEGFFVVINTAVSQWRREK